MSTAIASTARPFVISDSGDNPGAGGADDVTVALAELLSREEITEGALSAICASIYDPQALEVAEGAGVGAVVDVSVGGLRVIVTSRRNQYTTLEQFSRVGLDPRTTDIVVVKIGYLEPDLHDLAADWILALTPGGVDQDLIRLGHHRIDRPMFPFDPEMADPPLEVRR